MSRYNTLDNMIAWAHERKIHLETVWKRKSVKMQVSEEFGKKPKVMYSKSSGQNSRVDAAGLTRELVGWVVLDASSVAILVTSAGIILPLPPPRDQV